METEASRVLRQRKMERLRELEQSVKNKAELPHLYGFPWYEWAFDFFTTKNKMVLLTAANQVSKSSTQIRKMIHMATCPAEWPNWWRTRPRQFWYLYPTRDVATIEFNTKWATEFLPRGSRLNDKQYGWKAEYTNNRKIFAIHFNSGVSIYFKTYSTDVQHLQSGTAHYIGCDEELPCGLYDELRFRLAATNGYFSMVFTATLGQEFWRKAMEPQVGEEEAFPKAWKKTISLYDCVKYMDGSDSPWTYERIREIEESCSTENALKKRVMGRFVKMDGLKFPFYKSEVHKVNPPEGFKGKPEPGWYVYGAVDLGSGAMGAYSHPAAIVFIAVNPEFTRGRIIRAWRGDKQLTSDGDVFNRYMFMKADLNVTAQTYDCASADFGIIAQRNGEYFTKSEKNIDLGVELINTLFKFNMLTLDAGDTEIDKMDIELQNVSDVTQNIAHIPDDLVAALRYGVHIVPFNWVEIRGKNEQNNDKKTQKDPESRAEQYKLAEKHEKEIQDVDAGMEFEFWNNLMENPL